MNRKIVSLILLVTLWLSLWPLSGAAAPVKQDNGEDYIVQADDWLSKIAEKSYGNVLAYPAIVDATNAKAAEDDSYLAITNPDVIEVGQKLFVPASAGEYATIETATGTTSVQPATSRLFVADAEVGTLQVLDLSTEDVIGTLEVGSSARLYTTESGRFVAAVQRDANRVDFIDPGLPDSTPSMLSFNLDGASLETQNPVHFVSHHDQITVHFDGNYDEGVDAKNIVFSETELPTADPAMQTFTMPSHHGVSVPTADSKVIMTAPDPEREHGSLPSGFVVYDAEGTTLQTFNDKAVPDASCLGMHGEAVIGNDYLFGCNEDDGAMLILNYDETAASFSARELSYPDERRTSVFVAHPDQSFAVGNYGTYPDYNSLVRIDPQAEAIAFDDIVELPAKPCGFSFEQQTGEKVVTLTEDGMLRVLDPNNWNELATVEAAEPFECFGDAPAPSLVVGQGLVYVTRPSAGEVIEISLDTAEVVRTFTIDGVPSRLALVSQ